MKNKLIKVLLTIITATAFLVMLAGICLLLWWSAVQIKNLFIELLPEPQTHKSQVELNAEKRDECLANGFDYEFVDTFWYIGVRCKK